MLFSYLFLKLTNTTKEVNFARLFMRNFKKYVLFFVIGAIGYASIEIIWRGYTHWSMMIAGGLCFMMFSIIANKMKEKNIFMKAVVCAIGVTAVEFIFGVVFNIILKMNVWDYSHMPYNLLGQICPAYTLLWGMLAVAFLPFVSALNKSYA